MNPQARITCDRIAAVVQVMRANELTGDVPFRRDQLRNDRQGRGDDTEIRIHGRETVLESLAMGDGAASAEIPTFVGKWRLSGAGSNQIFSELENREQILKGTSPAGLKPPTHRGLAKMSSPPSLPPRSEERQARDKALLHPPDRREKCLPLDRAGRLPLGTHVRDLILSGDDREKRRWVNPVKGLEAPAAVAPPKFTGDTVRPPAS